MTSTDGASHDGLVVLPTSIAREVLTDGSEDTGSGCFCHCLHILSKFLISAQTRNLARVYEIIEAIIARA